MQLARSGAVLFEPPRGQLPNPLASPHPQPFFFLSPSTSILSSHLPLFHTLIPSHPTPLAPPRAYFAPREFLKEVRMVSN